YLYEDRNPEISGIWVEISGLEAFFVNVVRSQRLRGCLRPVAVAAPPPCSAAAEGSWPRRAGRSSSPAGTCFTYHRRRWLEVVDGEAAGVGVGHADHRRALHGGGRRRHERRHPRQGRHVWWAHPDGAHPLHVLVHAGRREHHRRRRHSAAHPHHLNHAIHIIIVGLSLINFSIELHSFYVVQTCSWSCSDLRYSIASSSIDALSV
ncbi:Os12g0610250, partial [Oryza sativa Japonica Group]